MAIDEESQSTYYTSRMGIRASEIIDYYNNDIKPRKNVTLEMLHFFVDTGIKDTMYYWSTFINAMKLYANLKRIATRLMLSILVAVYLLETI